MNQNLDEENTEGRKIMERYQNFGSCDINPYSDLPISYQHAMTLRHPKVTPGKALMYYLSYCLTTGNFENLSVV